MSVDHAPWCWSVYTPREFLGRYKTRPGHKTRKRSARCNCGASTSPIKRLLRRVREMVA